MVGMLSGDDWPTAKQNVKDKIGGIVVTAWKFWPLVHCITYGVIPARHRILWVNSVDLIWNAILASKAQKEQPGEERVNSDESSQIMEVKASSMEPADSLASVRHTVETLSPHEREAGEELAVQDVPLTGSSIEVSGDGDKYLVAGDDEETRVLIPDNAEDRTTTQDKKLSP